MNPKSFPRRLDSKTGCLRITVPENLDLALEGLIRKVLREQPKPDDLYAFAANYFETLLKIRDKAGAEYTSTQLCPFHNDEETREMIVLAGAFSRHVPDGVQGKGPAPLNTETKKETDTAEPERGLKRSKETLKDSHSEAENKQATPDLIKKLPLLAQNQGLDGEEVGGQKTTDLGHEFERTELVKERAGEEEYLTSDPIKEFVEKELLTERNSKEKVAEGEGPEPSEKGSPSPNARERQNEEVEGGAPLASNADEKKGAGGRDSPGTTHIVGGVIQANEGGEKRKVDPRTRETDEKGVEAGEVGKHAEDKTGDAVQPEGELPLEETQEKKEKEKENEEETSKLRAEEESQNKTETEAELPPLPPPPGAAEKSAPELLHEVSPSYNTEADVSFELEGGKVTRGAASSEVASPQERGIAEVGGVRQPAEDESETDAQRSTASPTKTDEKSPETSSLATNSYDSKTVENDDAETDKSQKSERKEATNSARDLMMEAASSRTERGKNSSETRSSPERAKGVQEVKEGGASFEKEGIHQTKGGESSKQRGKQDTKADDPSKSNLTSTEEGAKLTSAGKVEAEHAAGQSQAGAEDAVAEPGEEKGTELPKKLDPGQQAGGLKILKQKQFSHSHVMGSDSEAEIKSGDEEGKAAGGDKKLSDEEVKAKDESPTEGRESPGNQTSPEEELLPKAEDVRCAAEARTVESTDTGGRRTPLTGISLTTEGLKSEEKGDAKQETPSNQSGPKGDAGRLTEPGVTPEIATRDTESAKPLEFKVEEAPTAENETASLASEELCSVVDINHLKKDEGNQEEPKLGKPRPENTAEEKSAPEPEGSLSPSAPSGETCRENQNDKLSFQQEPEAEDAKQGKVESEEPPNATAVQEPVKSETDKGKGDSSEGTLPETWESFDPSAQGKQVIIVEEPEKTNENSEESSPPGEIQIKTIQTRYYDALRVPETVTREYRVREVVAPTIDGLLRPASPPFSILDEVQESPSDEERSGRLTGDNAVPPTPKTSPTSDGGVSPHAAPAEAQSYIGPPYHPSHVRADALLAVDELDRNARVSDSDDLPHLTTLTFDVASNLAELTSQAASETFLTKEKLFSSLEKEEIRFVTPGTGGARKATPEGQVMESSLEFDEGGEEIAAARPPPQTPEKTEGAEHVKDGGERPFGSSPALSDGRAANGDPPNTSGSERPVSEPRPQGQDEGAPDAPLPRRSATDAESLDKESFDLLQKNQKRNILQSCPEEVQVGSRSDGRRDSLSTKRTSTEEACYADADSTTSSATTEVKRADSARRDFASARGLSSARSLDLGKRNPLQRTRSLSTHRHGVADFEVWSTIEKELEEAATKIQSKFRGYKTRKKLRREVAVQISTEESSKRSTPVEADDDHYRPRATGEFHDGIVLAEHPR